MTGQRPSVSLWQRASAEHGLQLLRQLQQSELVSHPGAVLAQALRRPGTRATLGLFRADLHQFVDAPGPLDDVEVFPLQVLLEQVIDELFARDGQVIANNEVQRVQPHVDAAVIPALAVDQDVLGRPDPVFVVGPQGQVGISGDSHAGGQLRLTEFLTEPGLVLVGPEVAPGIEGGGGDFVQAQPQEFVGGYIPLRDGLGPAPGAAPAGSLAERRSGPQLVGDAHALILRAMVRITSDCSP